MTGHVPQPCAPDRVTGGQDAWDRSRVFWYGYYGAALAVTAGVVLTSSGVSARERIIASAVLGVMTIWYATLGRAVTQIPEIGAAREVTYLLVLFGLFVAGLTQTGSIAFILLAACPQCFFASSSWRRAVTFVVAFNVAPPVVATATDVPLAGDIDGTLPAVPPDPDLLTEIGAELGLGSSLSRFRAAVTTS